MAREFGIPFLGAIPIDPLVTASGDRGKPIIEGDPYSKTSKAFGQVVQSLLEQDLATVSSRLVEKTQES